MPKSFLPKFSKVFRSSALFFSYLVAIVRCDGEQIEKLFCAANVTAIIKDIDEVNEEMKIEDPVAGDEFTKLATFRSS